MQVDAGAIGISTATVWEAIVMVRSGLDSIFIVNTIAGREKLAALAAIARDANVMVAVDEANNAADVAAAARAAKSKVGVLIEVDTGMDRAGVDTPEQAVELARRVAGMDGVELLGVTGYEGHCSLTPERDLRAQRQRVAMDLLIDSAEQIKAAGLPCPIVSAGGTGTWDWTATTPGVTEVQADRLRACGHRSHHRHQPPARPRHRGRRQQVAGRARAEHDSRPQPRGPACRRGAWHLHRGPELPAPRR